jgi:hypothetical protein
MNIYELIIRPVTQRLGTSIGAALATYGMAAADVDTILSAFTLLCGLGIDLITRRLF